MTEQKRGFAALDPETRKEIARKGGEAAKLKGTAHRWTRKETREYGRIGGKQSRGGGREVNQMIKTMRETVNGSGSGELATLRERLKQLTPQERLVVERRIGLGCTVSTQEGARVGLGVSLAWVGRIEAVALKKLAKLAT